MFEADEKVESPVREIKAPEKGGVAGIYDPNYQVSLFIFNYCLLFFYLSQILNFLWSKDSFQIYIFQTLADLKSDIFDKDKKNVTPKIKAPDKKGMVGTFDPNYEVNFHTVTTCMTTLLYQIMDEWIHAE